MSEKHGAFVNASEATAKRAHRASNLPSGKGLLRGCRLKRHAVTGW